MPKSNNNTSSPAPDNNSGRPEYQFSVGATLTFVLGELAMLITGELILRSHPTAGHIILTVAGGILIITLLVIVIHDARKKKNGNPDTPDFHGKD